MPLRTTHNTGMNDTSATAPAPRVAVPPMTPGRRIEGISAVLLPFRKRRTRLGELPRACSTARGRPGLTPAVNMDTGYVHLLTPAERARVLAETRDVARGPPLRRRRVHRRRARRSGRRYMRAVAAIRSHGGTPILFQCSALARASEDGRAEGVRARGRHPAARCSPSSSGTMFAPFGRIYSADFIRRLLDLEPFVGAKHSSLDRALEWQRLELRDRHRPDFRVYTGNDLAIDMVFYGSDYLLGLSAFAVGRVCRARSALGRRRRPRHPGERSAAVPRTPRISRARAGLQAFGRAVSETRRPHRNGPAASAKSAPARLGRRASRRHPSAARRPPSPIL